MTSQYVVIEDTSYPVDTSEQIEIASQALADAGLKEAEVWNGEPSDPDSYPDRVRRLIV